MLAAVQERLENHPIGRASISILIAAVVAGAVVSNLPPSELRARALPRLQPLMNATGLEQSWQMFSPDPRSFAIGLRAEIEHANGSLSHWVPPRTGDIVGVYRWYRWQKWTEWVRSDERSDLWDDAAAWLARQAARAGRPAVRVRLIRRFYDIPPPGEPRPPWSELTFYTYEVPS